MAYSFISTAAEPEGTPVRNAGTASTDPVAPTDIHSRRRPGSAPAQGPAIPGAQSGPERASVSPSAHLIRIEGSLRHCATRDALWHHLANEPIALLPFAQALVFEAHAVGVEGRGSGSFARRKTFDGKQWPSPRSRAPIGMRQ